MPLRAIVEKAAEVREREIASRLAGFLAGEKSVLDVGCGSGQLALRISKELGVQVQGIDLRAPPNPGIPFKLFNGKETPFGDNSFDVAILVDVLHHVKGQSNRDRLLSECLRVARHAVIVKDHYYTNFLQRAWLKFVDTLTNIPSGVSTPFEFVSREQWETLPSQNAEYWSSFGIPNVLLKLKK